MLEGGRADARTRIRGAAFAIVEESGAVALQAEGRVTDAVDARALAMFVQAYSLGMALSDLTAPSREDIARVIGVAIGAFLR